MRDNEIQKYDRQIIELSKQVAMADSDVDHYRQIQDTLKADLEATKDLCDKLDHQKDKINDELNECSEIRSKVCMIFKKCFVFDIMWNFVTF